MNNATKPVPNDPETDNSVLYGRKKRDIEKDEESVELPGGFRKEGVPEDMELRNRKTNLEQLEDDAKEL
jgi:hypothetical protein